MMMATTVEMRKGKSVQIVTIRITCPLGTCWVEARVRDDESMGWVVDGPLPKTRCLGYDGWIPLPAPPQRADWVRDGVEEYIAHFDDVPGEEA